MRNYFCIVEDNGVFSINLKSLEDLPFYNVSGSYNVLKARLFDTTYANFLLIARDKYGAQLKGQTGYITEFFLDKNQARTYCLELNKRLNLALDEWQKMWYNIINS